MTSTRQELALFRERAEAVYGPRYPVLMAEEMEVSRTTVWRWLHGHRRIPESVWIVLALKEQLADSGKEVA